VVYTACYFIFHIHYLNKKQSNDFFIASVFLFFCQSQALSNGSFLVLFLALFFMENLDIDIDSVEIIAE